MGPYAFAEGGSRVFAPAGDSLSFASPKESKQRKGDPTVCVPALRFGQPAVLASSGVSLELAALRFAQTIASPDPLAAALLGAYRGDGEPNIQTATRAIASLGPLLWGQAPRTRRSACRVERSEDPNGCLGVHPLLAAPAAGRLRGGTRVGARVLRDLTRRGCPSGAAQQQSEFHGAPRNRPGAGLPLRTAKGSQTWGRLSFGYFSLAKQRKVPRPPGRNPGSRPWQRHAAKRLATNQITMNSIATSACPISARAQLNPQTPAAPCGTWFRSNHRVSRAASVSGWRDSSVASTRSAMSARFMPCSSTRATSS